MKGDEKIFLTLIFVFFLMPAGVDLYAQDQTQPGITPRCRTDADCQHPGLKGLCRNPGQSDAGCVFLEATPVTLEVVVPVHCRVCNPGPVVEQLTDFFPGLTVTTLTADLPQAKKLIDDFNVEMLPAFFLGKEVESEPNFAQIKSVVSPMGERYFIRPEFSGAAYFFKRKIIPDRLDIFLGITHSGAAGMLNTARAVLAQPQNKISIDIHLVAKQDAESKEFMTLGGKREVNEGIIYACVDRHAGQKSWDYLECRAADIDSLFWQDCLKKNKINVESIERCARSQEGGELLAAKTKLSQELSLLYPSLILLDNVEIFGMTTGTSADEILKVIGQDRVIK